MQLMSLKCPNCNGDLKMVKEGTFYCANCDSAFVADYDKDDVEYQKMKVEAEIRKQNLNQAQIKAADNTRRAKDSFRIKMIVLAVVAGIALTIVVPTVIVTLRTMTREAEIRHQQEIEREEQRKAEEKEKEEKRRLEEEARKAEEEAERRARLAAFRITPDDIAGDEFFIENANRAIERQLWNNTSLFYTDWAWNEDPEYITSYLLFAKDENDREQNMLVSIYKIHWDKELDDTTERYDIYDCACLTNISKNEDGTLSSDYTPDGISYHSELIRNQFLSGYEDYDELIRQEIYGNPDFEYQEFTMPGYDNASEE